MYLDSLNAAVSEMLNEILNSDRVDKCFRLHLLVLIVKNCEVSSEWTALVSKFAKSQDLLEEKSDLDQLILLNWCVDQKIYGAEEVIKSPGFNEKLECYDFFNYEEVELLNKLIKGARDESYS